MFTSENKGYLKPEKKREVVEAVRESILNKSYITHLTTTLDQRIKELEEICVQISTKNVSGLSSRQLCDDWLKFSSVFKRFIPWYYIPWYITEENLITDRIKNALKKYSEEITKVTDLNNALMTLVFPQKKTELQREQDDLAELLTFALKNKNYKKSKEFNVLVSNYLNSYAWTSTFLFLPRAPLGIDDVYKKVESGLEQNDLKDFAFKIRAEKETAILRKKLVGIIKEDEELTYLVEQAQLFGYLQQTHVEESFIATAQIQDFFAEIATRVGSDKDHWIYLFEDEIAELLSTDRKVDPEELEKRKEAYVYKMEKNKRNFFTADEAIKIIEEIKKIEQVSGTITEFTGQPAYPGKIEGVVKVCETPAESKDIKEGEVLVCPMTTPDYVPAMKKAGAIVTSEGGLLSHAAIMSRELKTPCLVGTKIATQVLKDGDLVEVDANKGEVRIIEK